MQEHKWSEHMANFIPLPYSHNGRYPVNGHGRSNNIEGPSQISLPLSPPIQLGLMSISQPETPRPAVTDVSRSSSTSSNNEGEISPDLIRKMPPTPSKSASFTTTTFHSNPYSSAGPVRRRRTESIFSFEMGPTFINTKQLCDLYGMDRTNRYVQLHTKMDRGFFKADRDWTCYRRNYFQVSATFDILGMDYIQQSADAPCFLRNPKTQELCQVDYFSIGVGACVPNQDKKIELVQHTPKRDKGPQNIPEPRHVWPGGNLHLASVGPNQTIATFERLQFKTATANNGKRRAAQQYYEITVNLFANFSAKEPICVATCISEPLVVRGRSPGHYADTHTKFKHMDPDAPILNEKLSSASLSTNASSEDRFGGPHLTSHLVPMMNTSSSSAGMNHYHHSSSHDNRIGSLPNSPISDFGPYSHYNNYPYPSLSTGHASIMHPPATSHYSPVQHNTTNGPYYNEALFNYKK